MCDIRQINMKFGSRLTYGRENGELTLTNHTLKVKTSQRPLCLLAFEFEILSILFIFPAYKKNIIELLSQEHFFKRGLTPSVHLNWYIVGAIVLYSLPCTIWKVLYVS